MLIIITVLLILFLLCLLLLPPLTLDGIRGGSRPGPRDPGLTKPWIPGKDLGPGQIPQIYSNRLKFFAVPCPETSRHARCFPSLFEPCMGKGTALGKRDTTLPHRQTFTRKIMPATDKRLDEENMARLNLPQATWIETFPEGVTDKSTGLPLFSGLAWFVYMVSGVMCSVSACEHYWSKKKNCRQNK